MSRPPRVLSSTGLYHVIFKGINGLNIFEDTFDYKKMLEILATLKEKEKIQIYAYCLMTNHVHLFLKENEIGDIKKVMHKLLTTYVGWFNRKYMRNGTLVANRYKSEPIEDEKYYMALIRYIHQNPVKAGLCATPDQYKWSSYNDYLSNGKYLTDTEFTLAMLSPDSKNATEIFVEMHKSGEQVDFSITDNKKLTTAQICRKIEKISGILPEKISQLSRQERNSVLSKLRQEGLTIGQLERATGISRGVISKVLKK